MTVDILRGILIRVRCRSVAIDREGRVRRDVRLMIIRGWSRVGIWGLWPRHGTGLSRYNLQYDG